MLNLTHQNYYLVCEERYGRKEKDDANWYDESSFKQR